MLSSGNPSSDPSERSIGSDDNQLQIYADLPKPGLDCQDPEPKFSIRDYVFNTRGKDLENHWPFSKKSLQLCLKRSVENVLPPYQSLSRGRNHSVFVNAAENVEDSKLRKVQSSERISVLEPEELAVPVVAEKAKNSAQNPLKKCRLRVKLSCELSCSTEPKKKEDVPGNSSVVLEAMASKICPVCKTFSSSSNTTLNAHIDQCLSVEPSEKWPSNSKVTRLRIRPRKARLMVDVYATSRQCTLEDLEKRNGINRAAVSSFQEFERGSEQKSTVPSPVNVVNDKSDEIKEKFSVDHVYENEGAVYFDSSGTKVRILSKLNDLQQKSCPRDDTEPRKIKKNLHLTESRKLLRRPSGKNRSSLPASGLKARKINEEEPHSEDEDEDVLLHSSRRKCDGSTRRKNLEKRNQNEWKITKTRSALLGFSSLMKKASDSTSTDEEEDELPHLRKKTKMCDRISDSLNNDRISVQKKLRSSLVGSENETSAQRRLLSHEKKSDGLPVFSRGGNLSSFVTKSSVLLSERKSVERAFPDFGFRKKRCDISRKERDEASKRSDISHEPKTHEVGTSYKGDALEKAEVEHLVVHESDDSRFPGHVIPIDSRTVARFEEELDVFEEQGKYFVDVEPIPIPGPPGSFLPSPGHVSSEEQQGNSSLTTCMVHSSEDEHELAASTESADSPISGTSFVSNSITADRNPPLAVNASSYDPMAVGSTGLELDPSSSRFENGQTYLRNDVTELTYREPGPQISAASPFAGLDAKFSAYGGSVSVGSSPSAVLRLMGKNLTVVNKVESLPYAAIPSQSSFRPSSQSSFRPSSQSSFRPSSHYPSFQYPVFDPARRSDSYPYHHSGFATDFGMQLQFQPSMMIRHDDPVRFQVTGALPSDSAGFSASGYGYGHVNRICDYSAPAYFHDSLRNDP